MENKNIYKALMGVVVLVVILIIGYFARNYIIINKIANKQNVSNNYLLNIEIYPENGENVDKLIIEQYYKDGKVMQMMKNSVRTVNYWYDEETKETITMYPAELIASSSKSNSIVIFDPFLIKDKMNMALSTSISFDEVNGEQCYVLKRGKHLKDYVSVERGIVVKEINENSVIEYKSYTKNVVTDENVSKPDLTGYGVN